MTQKEALIIKQSFFILSFLFLLGAGTAISADSDFIGPQLEADSILNDEERAFLARIKVIRKCVDPHWMPLEKIDQYNQHVGVIADILKLVEQKIDTPIELVPTKNWPESMEKLEKRECDIVSSDTADGIPPDHYLKTKSFLKHRNVYITRNDSPLQLDFSSIKDKPIGIPKGYPTIDLIRQHYGEVNFVEVKNAGEGLLKVSRGELYAFTDLLPICSYSIQRQGLTNLKVAGHLDISFPTVIAVRSDMPELVEIFNKTFTTIDNSTINEFLSQWIKVEYDIKFDWSTLIKYLAVTLVFVGLMLFWNRKLRILNNKLDKANAELRHLNETDALTKMKNRNFLAHRLPGLVKIANRNSLSLGIAMLDIDHFKHINDTYGHAVGDECLAAYADKMHEVFQRESDTLIRYGGEEFLLLCIGMTVTEFAQNLERLRHEIETKGLSLESKIKAEFSVSTGYVFHPVAPSQWDETLITEADENLYQAKETGRNRIVGTEKLVPSSSS